MTALHLAIGEPTHEVAPDLWGLFFEDINTCLDGGLNAELIRNGDFEFNATEQPDWGPLTGWEAAGEGTVQLRADDPIHPNNRHYLRLTGPLTLTNDGWDGVALEPGATLRFHTFAWLVNGTGSLRARVVAPDGTELAGANLAVPERGWSAVSADLTSAVGNRTPGEFQLEVPNGMVVEVDVLSLRPLGADGEPLTFRPDLVAALRDLNPSFVRFPGGCVAHGVGLDNMYHWKPTIGPRYTRRQMRNLWGYHQSRQIGYFEFFELCELLGAGPLPVVVAGVCCSNLRGGAQPIPEADMPAYIADVLDLIEFANGDPTTTWGAKRAELGHPEPFGLRYLGVGNEDEITQDFRDRYAQIEDAVRAAHPEVTVVGTAGPFPNGPDFDAGWAFARSRGTQIVDEHCYHNPRWYFQNVDRYDTYPRDGSAVYFGEYSANTSTVRSALAEAAFMLGMERNSDVVRLASYAPLLARVGATQWVPDLLYFDDAGVIPSASYHVQAMFGRERGERVHASELTGAPVIPVVPVAGPGSGSLRARAPQATVELTSIMLDGGALPDAQVSSASGEVLLATIDPGATVVELVLRRTAGAGGAVLILGGEGSLSRIELDLGCWANHATAVNRVDDGISHNEDGPHRWTGMPSDTDVAVRIELLGARVRVWVDGALRHDFEQDLRPEQRVSALAMSRGGGAEYLVRAVNATDEARLLTIGGPPAAAAAPAPRRLRGGDAVLLAGAGPDEGEPFVPSPVTPQRAAVSLTSDGLAQVELPPWSFAVITLH